MKKSMFIFASAIAVFALEAQAQGGMGGMGGGERPEFASLDTDESGSLSLEELTTFNADRAEAFMSRMDVDEDGSISEEEWTNPPRGQNGGMGGGMGG